MRPATVDEAHGLTARQLAAITDLERGVVAHDGGRLKLELGFLKERPPDEVNDLLAWDGDTLVGFCGIYTFGSEPELSGAVDPSHRRRGIGSALVAHALVLAAQRRYPSVLLVTPRATDAGRRFAESKGAVFHHAEHHMELTGAPVGPPRPRPSTAGLLVREATDADKGAIVTVLAEGFGEDAAGAGLSGPTDVALVAELGGDVVGALRLSAEDGEAGIYGLAVKTDLRGQGIGRAILYEVCLEARRRGAAKVMLEVEVDNDNALHLYTSVGFELKTTEDYFRLAVPGIS